jgi:hypothetical protein
MSKARHDAEVQKLRGEVGVQPFVELARQLEAEVARIAADPDAGVEALVEVFDRLPHEARLDVARATFAALPAERQWTVLEGLFDDDDLRAALADDRARRVERAQHLARHAALVEHAASHRRLDTRLIPPDEQLTLGLFREEDVRAALLRGRAATTCARRLVLVATAPAGTFEVVEDVFNPTGALFVTADYDDATWRAERLPAHAVVRVGGLLQTDRTEHRFEPVLQAGGRFDVELGETVRPGRLHVGFALLGDDELFSDGAATQPPAGRPTAAGAS